jgi:hypothetical protein
MEAETQKLLIQATFVALAYIWGYIHGKGRPWKN